MARELWQKLGLTPGLRVDWEGAPDHLPELLGPGLDGVIHAEGKDALGMLHVFMHGPQDLGMMAAWRGRIAEDGMVWVSWPKKRSRLFCGVTEDDIRDVALDGDMVDVKVCAVDEDWSGLKLVVRKHLRRT